MNYFNFPTIFSSFSQKSFNAFRIVQEEASKARWAALPALQKNFYDEHPDVANMLAEKVDAIRITNNNTTVDRLFRDENENDSKMAPIPNPVETFEQCFAKYPDLLGSIFILFQFCRSID